MKLSTSTNLIAFRPDWVSYIRILDSMRQLKKAGFDGYLTGEVFKADDNMSWTAYNKKIADNIHGIIKDFA